MGNSLTLSKSNAEATLDVLDLSNNDTVLSSFDVDYIDTLAAKTISNLTHHEKKYAYRANNYFGAKVATF